MSRKNDALLKEATERYDAAVVFDRENRIEALDDMENLIGLQWAESEKEQRETDGRPCLTINKLPQFLRQVTGDLRRTNPAIKVLPGDAETDKDGADVIESIVRQIQYKSDASSVYESAAESAAACGMGAFRVLTDYVSDNSFLQEICIEAIRNPFAVYWDPKATDPTRCDADWCFVSDRMTKAAFEKAYPGKAMAEVKAEQVGDMSRLQHWRQAGDVIVAEYFWKEYEDVTIYMGPDGQATEKKPRGEAKSRQVKRHKVMWAKISGADVLEGPLEFPSKHIPVIAVMGEELHVGSSRYRSSVIRFAKDPQRMYNYWRSAQTEIVALQPKAPFIATPKQIAGRETEWGEANRTNAPVLLFNPDEKFPGAPQRQQPPVASQGMTEAIMLASQELKDTTGIYDAGLGNRSNEQSGVAIRQRQMESDISTSIYSDNMAKAVAQCGRIVVDMLPKVYDTYRRVAALGKDETEGVIEINKPMRTADGPVMVNNMAAGKYDVKVAVGPNYTTKRQETAESMMQFVQAFPAAAQVAGDLIAGAMDWPGADQIADRLKKTLPPGLVEEESPQAQQAQMQAQQVQQEQSDMAKEMAVLRLEEQRAKTEQARANAAKAKAEAAEAALATQGFIPAPPPYGA